MNKKFWIGLAIAGGAVCCLACLCLAIFALAYFREGQSDQVHIQREIELDYVQVQFDTPQKVRVGDDFTLEMQIANNSDLPRELDSIDLYQSYLEGLTLKSSEPDYLGYRTIPADGGFISYAYMQAIPANRTMIVKFELTAIKEGKYSGPVFVCVTGPTICNEYSIQVTVEK